MSPLIAGAAEKEEDSDTDGDDDAPVSDVAEGAAHVNDVVMVDCRAQYADYRDNDSNDSHEASLPLMPERVLCRSIDRPR